MNCPPLGICIECKLVKVRDGDTVEIQARVADVWAIRLIDCWADKKATPSGREATHFLKSWFEQHKGSELRLWLPPLKDTDGDGVLDLKEIMQQMTFDRVPGRLFLNGWDLSEIMVENGHAYRTKAEQDAANGK